MVELTPKRRAKLPAKAFGEKGLQQPHRRPIALENVRKALRSESAVVTRALRVQGGRDVSLERLPGRTTHSSPCI